MKDEAGLVRSIQRHLLDAVAAAPLRPEPFAHLHCPRLMPDALFQWLYDAYPREGMTPPPPGGTGEDLRRRLDIGDSRWFRLPETKRRRLEQVYDFEFSQRFGRALVERFLDHIPGVGVGEGGAPPPLPDQTRRELTHQCLPCRWHFVTDHPGYQLEVHTDLAIKAVTALLYFSPVGTAGQPGTTIYRPRPGLEHLRDADGMARLPFADFEPVWEAPHQGNSLFAFARNERAFHGVRPVPLGNGPRESLIFLVHRQLGPATRAG
ncbi:MAG: hypothetical protein NVV74_03170 [Magnetospirillum sp.]|nr:hypothetical protein [Magnetospirillum sp.]